jgi:hypothetical protein
MRVVLARFVLAVLIAVLTGCTTVAKMESGEQTVGEKLVVHLEGAWHHVNAPGIGPAHTWTMEGLPVDQLRIYVGVKDGETVHQPDSSGKLKNFSFRSSMQADDVVAMFEGVLTRDGSVFKLGKLEPMSFAGQKGFRFEFSVIRKLDGVQISGVGYGAVIKGELYAILYGAPQLGFFARHQPRVEQMALSAKLKL